MKAAQKDEEAVGYNPPLPDHALRRIRCLRPSMVVVGDSLGDFRNNLIAS
jgi:hypothetical protein